MTNTVLAVIREGRIDTLEPIDLPDGVQVLVTVRSADEGEFWQDASQKALRKVWDNTEDDVYAALLRK